jgi:large subunit ribosomal protein L6
MSRVAKKPITLPSGVDFTMVDSLLTVKGSKGSIQMKLHDHVQLKKDENTIVVVLKENTSKAKTEIALAGTTRAIVQNMVTGVSQGFEQKLVLVGVGYRAQAQGSTLNLSLGFSHPVKYEVPEGITIETPSQTEVLVKGIDKQLVGEVSADIRSFRPPEPYKGKGVRYLNEVILLKEGKKK